jgi:hypothetical protein
MVVIVVREKEKKFKKKFDFFFRSVELCVAWYAHNERHRGREKREAHRCYLCRICSGLQLQAQPGEERNVVN